MTSRSTSAHSGRALRTHRRALACGIAMVIGSLCVPAYSFAFPLTPSLSTAGRREFHFCRLDVTLRPAPCAGTANCLDLDSPWGSVAMDIDRVASPAETSPGTALLQDMFPYVRRLSLIGDAAVMAPLRTARDATRFELRAFVYPSGRRLLVLDAQPR